MKYLLTLAVVLAGCSPGPKLTPLYRLSHDVYGSAICVEAVLPDIPAAHAVCDKSHIFTDHMWTTDPHERDMLEKEGWRLESIKGHEIMVVQR